MSVSTKISYVNDVKNVLFEEANAMVELGNRIDNSINMPIETIINCKGRIIITGVGKSGIIGKKIAATLSSTGTPSFFLHPAEGLHGDLGMVTPNDIVLAISNSGESEEVIHIIPSIKRIGAEIIGLVGNEDSTIGRKSDHIICIGKVKEACPLGLAPTTSTTLSLALGDAISVALLKARKFKPEHFAVFHPGGALGKRLLYTVQDVIENNDINPNVLYNSSGKDVIFKMTSSGLGAVSIVNEEGVIKGILTDGDIRRALASRLNILEEPVESIYNRNPITINSEVLAVEALNIMEKNRINVLPVINEVQKPIAMIHIQDLIRLGL